ncbi:hypothetical protein HanRHA438_Chr06g0274321 [Helianthus annuus]|nr:hypothetical protein HanHA300_Chr06g0217511 [Helianthus annuus]KAJ0567477.1 hypothetical protein HanIR_Chr06g0285241 [Helianthus annuus]KAJ0574012.1 hypothetical protein HanHA89_Chr06g0233311 [Helianthus annuus]KAJ0738346.1 hypothetical protein HanLR1_Chr06g0217241 [Helianthus annuus]KAJ0741235.1 hypothetical protein HanOQP8_Chr06g0225761 [Helianthus annuus]
MWRFRWLVPATLEPVLYANDCLHCLQQARLQPGLTVSMVKYSHTIDFFFRRLLGGVSTLSVSTAIYTGSRGISMSTSALFSVGIMSILNEEQQTWLTQNTM